MGLDMFLLGERHLYNLGDDPDIEVSKTIANAIGLPENKEINSVKIEVGYWRKSNQIHRWFVKNVQNDEDDCGYYDVGTHDLTQLKEVCERVLADRTLASSMLPTASGFFFGATEYDDWYYTDLEETIKIIDTALAMSDRWSFQYHSSW